MASCDSHKLLEPSCLLGSLFLSPDSVPQPLHGTASEKIQEISEEPRALEKTVLAEASMATRKSVALQCVCSVKPFFVEQVAMSLSYYKIEFLMNFVFFHFYGV